MVCKWQVEIDEYANRVLAKHWPNVRRWPDVRTWPQPDTERVDVICGGFPCQDISYAGLGAGLDGARSGLFFEVIRLVQQLQPRVVVLENVAALLTRGLDRVLGSLAEIGFDAEWDCLPAKNFGAPHARDRVFLIAYAEGWRLDGVGKKVQKERAGKYIASFSPFWRLIDLLRVDVEPNFAKPCSGIERDDDGIPEGLDRLKGCGNAVVPQVAQFIGERIVAACQQQQK